MKAKNIIVSIITLAFIWSVLSMSYIDNSNINDTKLAFSYGFIDFLIMTLAMMIIPAIAYFKNGGVFEFERGKKLCQRNIWIALGVLFVKDIILMGGIYDEVIQNFGSNMVYSLIYYLINKALFVSDEKNVKKVVNNKIAKDEKKVDEYVINSFVEEENDIDIQKIEPEEDKNVQKSSFCKNCGGKLDIDKKCTKCGKQYLNIKINITIVFMFIIIIALLIFVNKQSNSIDKLESEISNLTKQIETLEAENLVLTALSDLRKNKTDFLDENIAIVIEGYGNYYYTYDCVLKLTEGEEYSYWAYNVEQAIARGYKKGSCY